MSDRSKGLELYLDRGPQASLGASGKPSNWSTWWIMDGGDDAASLAAGDRKGRLNDAVERLAANPLCLEQGIK